MPTLAGEHVHNHPGQLPLLKDVHAPAVERMGFVEGLFQELKHQLGRHLDVVSQLALLQGRVEITERTLALTRDHLMDALGQTDEDVPQDWQEVLNEVRFVGVRLGDACVGILRRRETLTTQEIADELNKGQFRFRTNTPLKEVTAALLRQPRVKRQDDRWVYLPRDDGLQTAEKGAA
jgi:hypothetical protein